MKLWKIMLAALVCVLMLSAVAMAEAPACTHETYAASYVPTNTYYQVPGDNEHYHVFNVTYICNVCNSIIGTEQVQVAEYCAYTIKGETVKATCTEGQYTVYRCVCGASDKEYSTDWGALGHDFQNKKLDAGNCQVQPTWASVCTRCGLQNGDSFKWGTGDHVWSVSKVEPTCTKDGWIYKTCTVKDCGEEVDEKIPADGKHRWDYAKTVVVAPTCTDQGYSSVVCMDCGYATKHEYVAALGHDYKFHAAVEAKCNQVGNDAYWTCSRCPKIFKGSDANVVLSAIPYIPVNTTAHEIENGKWTYNITSCTADNNTRSGKCIICGKTVTEKLPAAEHKFAAASQLAGKAVGVHAGIGVVTKASTCTTTGKGYVVCTVCRAQTQLDVTIPAMGHKMPKTWSYSDPATCTEDMYAYRYCERGCGEVEIEIIAPAFGHNWKVVEGSTTATCDKAGICNRICTNCGIVENNVIVPATGHDYESKVTAATCTKDGEKVSTCKVCGDKKTEKIPAAHGATKEVAGKAPACGVAGTIDVICTVCNAKVGEKAVAALSHEYSWVVVTKPSAAGNGRNEYKCTKCGDVAKVETVKYSNWYYNNTFTSFGPATRELVGGNDWYRVTPVDLTVDGVYTYDLIASNKYVVGKVTIAVNAGALTVSYKTNNNVEVNAESLLIYANKADLAAGVAVSAPVGAAIDAAANFPGDSKVLVSLVLTGNYDAAGKSTMDASAAAGMVANID